MSGLYNVGAYVRLSKDSVAYRKDESLSIENQKYLLSKFISLMPGWMERKYYIDDGFSGGSFDRPAFQEMMEDVRQGHINLVLVKDLSRFGRNYLEAGQLLEQELPSYGCRFVSLSEGIDTENGEDDIIPFLNAMNDHYLKNLSERIKSVLTAKAKDGQKLSGYAPYGYRRMRENHTRLEIDPYAAEIVRRIYELRTQGLGYAKIASVLNEDKVLAPRLYYYASQNREPPKNVTKLWFSQTVRVILRNEVYIGNTVAFKLATRFYRDNTAVARPSEDWIRVNHTHEPIIDTELWKNVQALDASNRKIYGNSRVPIKSLFSGLLVCAGCGKTLIGGSETHTRKTGKKVTYNHYHCRTYSLTGGSVCTRHTIYELSLKQVVLAHIHEQAKTLELNEAAMMEELKHRLIGQDAFKMKDRKIEIRTLKRRIHKLEAMVVKLYEDRAFGIVPEDVFLESLETLDLEKQEKEKRLAAIEQTQNSVTEKVSDIQQWAQCIRKKANFDDIDREVLENLIEKIEVGERVLEGRTKNQSIKIFYRFVGLME